MDHIGIDVRKRESQICILAEGGELIERRIRTEPERFAAVLGTRPRARVLIEASSEFGVRLHAVAEQFIEELDGCLPLCLLRRLEAQ